MPGFSHGTVAVQGSTLHYVRGGSGPPLILLHGWPQTWWEWSKVMPALAENHTVIAFDLPGLGDSSIPSDGFDKVTTAKRIREGVQKLGFTQVSLLAHDTGSLVAYPYARDYPNEVTRMAVLETPLSGFGLEDFYGVSFHLGLNQTVAPVPEALIDNDDVSTYLGWMFSGARYPDRIDQAAFFQAYASPARRGAGYEYYRAFAADATNNQANATKRLPMPVLAMGAEFTFGPVVANSFSQVGDDVRGVIAPDSGHWIAEENPQFLIDCAELFFGPAGTPAPRPELATCVA
ncbi:alpha/beta hydrolase [Actinophytocola xinjiangensis]|uniref:Alpha/beta hydrolase n=1 Tax=Actinophytocola xinjiangensis TaxID=485602 RepID=A0A7Z1AZ97_9PSEU|nr:alpha/beta hydrolase [Actinophytocola xinjiangensis]